MHAQNEQKPYIGGEAVAEVCEDQSGSKYLCWNPGLTPLPPAGTKLYTAPPSAPVGVEWLAKRIETYHWDVADKLVAAKFAAELRALAAQPGGSDNDQ